MGYFGIFISKHLRTYILSSKSAQKNLLQPIFEPLLTELTCLFLGYFICKQLVSSFYVHVESSYFLRTMMKELFGIRLQQPVVCQQLHNKIRHVGPTLYSCTLSSLYSCIDLEISYLSLSFTYY